MDVPRAGFHPPDVSPEEMAVLVALVALGGSATPEEIDEYIFVHRLKGKTLPELATFALAQGEERCE